jgi:membrane protein DedA with SNARE-associated domain
LFEQAALSFFVSYGYWAIFVIVMLESAGLPLPGETILIAAAIYAGTTEEMDIRRIVLAAAAGAAIGDSFGYWIGRRYGFPLLLRFGRYVGLGEGRLKLGQYLFGRYGGGIVFFGRFVATLRMFAALLAGANRFPWPRFVLFNVAGGVVWASAVGVGGYMVGEILHQFAPSIAVVLALIFVVLLVVAGLVIRRHEKRLLAKAEAAIPGPLTEN